MSSLQSLSHAWADDNPKAYLGITVPGFPNFLCMHGPNANAGHGGSAIFLAESQTRYRNRHGRVVSTMPFRLVDYWAMTHAPDLADFITTPR